VCGFATEGCLDCAVRSAHGRDYMLQSGTGYCRAGQVILARSLAGRWGGALWRFAPCVACVPAAAQRLMSYHWPGNSRSCATAVSRPWPSPSTTSSPWRIRPSGCCSAAVTR
jgi:hypothetical protein